MNSKLTDRAYLKDDQYRNSANLQARMNLHSRFNTNPYSWTRWVLDHAALDAGQSVLEVGSGPAMLWRENLEILSENIRITLADLSSGMVEEARQHLAEQGGFDFLALDVQALPFPDRSFDLVFANHMLYHVPDISQGVHEIARVLKPGGRLVAATNSQRYMVEMHELIHEFYPAYTQEYRVAGRFSLENGTEILAAAFPQVSLHRFESDLVVTEVEPLLAYILSLGSITESGLPAARLDTFLRRRMVEAGGKIRISKSQGLFVAVNHDLPA